MPRLTPPVSKFAATKTSSMLEFASLKMPAQRCGLSTLAAANAVSICREITLCWGPVMDVTATSGTVLQRNDSTQKQVQGAEPLPAC